MGDVGGTGTIRLGVLGCADVAARRVLPAVVATPGVRVAGLASRSRSKAEAFASRFGGEPVIGYHALLHREDVDAVYIALPAGMHAEWIANALHAGKHVLAEKPLTTLAARTAELVRLADRQGLVLLENFMFHRHSQHAAVRKMLDDGAIGSVRSFTAAFAIPPRPANDIRYQRSLGGGALIDVGGYPVRATQLFLGQELEVLGAFLRYEDTLGVDVSGAALLSDARGVTAQLSFGLCHAYTSCYQFLGSTGRLSLDHVFAPAVGHRPVVRLDRPDHREELTLATDDQYARSVEAFVDAVRADPRSGSDITLNQARLVEEIRSHAEPS